MRRAAPARAVHQKARLSTSAWHASLGQAAAPSPRPRSKPTAFGGAAIDDPWECMASYTPKLKAAGADLVIPLCHLYEPQDERTAREFDFTLILSGHDHHVVDKVVEGSRILKPGLDGIQAFVIDIVWDDREASAPAITAELVQVADFAPDAALEAQVKQAYSLIDNLRNTQLTVVRPFPLPPLACLSSAAAALSPARSLRASTPPLDPARCLTSSDRSLRRTRAEHASRWAASCARSSATRSTRPRSRRARRYRTASLLAPRVPGCPPSMITPWDSQVDCVLIKAGSCPRASKTYGEDEHITLEALPMEIQAPNEIFVYPVPGKVIKYGLREQWEGGVGNPQGQPNPGWIHEARAQSPCWLLGPCSRPSYPLPPHPLGPRSASTVSARPRTSHASLTARRSASTSSSIRSW